MKQRLICIVLLLLPIVANAQQWTINNDPNNSWTPVSVPESGSLILLALGVLILVLSRNKRK